MRFRFDNQTADVLSKIHNSSDYVRQAVTNKLISDGIIKSDIPF